jgi:hypothetical protein
LIGSTIANEAASGNLKTNALLTLRDPWCYS